MPDFFSVRIPGCSDENPWDVSVKMTRLRKADAAFGIDPDCPENSAGLVNNSC